MFDIDYAGRWLGVGDNVCLSSPGNMLETYVMFQKGGVRLFDLWKASHTDSQAEPLPPTLKYAAHNGTIRPKIHHRHTLMLSLDAIGSVGFNPLKPWLLSVTGSRNFDEDMSGSDDSDNSSEDEGTEVMMVQRRPNSKPVDTSIKLWDFAPVQGEQRSVSRSPPIRNPPPLIPE